MREYELVIDEAFTNGLNPLDSVPMNAQLLAECIGMRCGEVGLEAYDELTNPLPSTLDLHYNWPFPQFIKGEGYNLLIVRDAINAVDEIYEISNDHATATLVMDVQELLWGQGTIMEVADFGNYALLVNGVVIVFRNVAAGSWNISNSLATIPLMRTICNLNGQAVGGCVTSDWYDCDETYYVWSKIGSADFTPEQDNEAGYRRDLFGGEVLHTKVLGNRAVGYSTKGISFITPVNEPATTMGFAAVYDVGPVNRGAVGGNLIRHIYVGSDYRLREVTAEGVKRLGYRNYMSQLAGEDIIISYNELTGDFYIGNSDKTYLFANNKLSEITQHPSAVWTQNGSAYLLPDTVDDTYPMIATVPFDIGYKGLKTITVIESNAFSVSGPEAGVDYSYDLESWGTGTYKPVNKVGVASVNTTAAIFKFKLRFEELLDSFTLNYLKVRYKMSDLRSIRGVHAPPPRGQANA